MLFNINCSALQQRGFIKDYEGIAKQNLAIIADILSGNEDLESCIPLISFGDKKWGYKKG